MMLLLYLLPPVPDVSINDLVSHTSYCYHPNAVNISQVMMEPLMYQFIYLQMIFSYRTTSFSFANMSFALCIKMTDAKCRKANVYV
jgi:hypothetical protein